jgi:DivIVA domain-containing protein
MDRQAIERRDFPIVRRGYDPASVDAHLRSLAAAVEELRQQAGGSGRDSLASAAGAQVQGILEAAQASAQAIEAEAAEHARQVREDAAAEARRTREQAIATAQERVAAVTEATDALLQRVAGMDGETRTLVESLRGGAGRLAADLQALDAQMGTLYDAAAGRAGAPADVDAAVDADAGAGAAQQVPTEPIVPARAEPAAVPQNGAAAPARAQPAAESQPAAAPTPVPAAPAAAEREPSPGAQDVDGARLVALNMALNGDSREATGRYLTEHFDIAEPGQLLDEVYAAIEG